MARIRTIKPEFPQSESVGRLSRDARLLFIQLWTIVDDCGRARAPSRMLASLLYPYDDDAPALIEGWLAELDAEGCIVRYEVDGSKYLSVAKWLEHQKIDRPSKSQLPAPREPSRALVEPSSTDLVPRTMDLGGENNNNPPSASEGGAVEPIASQGHGSEPEPDPEPADEIPASLDRRQYPEAFEALWSVYRPIAAKNATKADACAAWRVLSEPDKAACLDGLRLYVAWMAEPEQRRAGTKAKHLATFIERRGWEPFTEAQPMAKAATLWVPDDDSRWPDLAERWRTERGKPPPVIAGTHGHAGHGWHYPAEWVAH